MKSCDDGGVIGCGHYEYGVQDQTTNPLVKFGAKATILTDGNMIKN